MADYDWDFSDPRQKAKDARVRAKVKELRDQLLEMGYDAIIEEQYTNEQAIATEAVCVHCDSMVGVQYLEKHQEFLHPYPRG